jgi:uncharacterized damage-inducible protein DinB
MPIAQEFLTEFEMQAPITRKFLERLPENKLTWKPHEKSMTAGQLGLHIATVPGGIVRFIENTPAQVPEHFEFPQPASSAEILNAFDGSIATVRSLLPKYDDRAMEEIFHMMAGDKELMAMPRKTFVREIMFSHWYQHRGQLSVYLRILNVAVPSSWGPSADEPVFMPQAEPAMA